MKALSPTLPLILILAASTCLAQSFVVTQGMNQFYVTPLVPSATTDLLYSIADKINLTSRATNIANPYDEQPGLLTDGNLYYFRVVGSGGRDIATFYGYNTSDINSASIRLTRSDESRVFLYGDASSGQFYLVVLHDQVYDGTGGTAVWDFAGLPPSAVLALEDDPDGTLYDSYLLNGDGTCRANWQWGNCCTDGFALGGLENTMFSIDVTTSFGTFDGGQIATLAFLTDDAASPTVIAMDRDTPFNVAATSPAVLQYRYVIYVTKNTTLDTVSISW